MNWKKLLSNKRFSIVNENKVIPLDHKDLKNSLRTDFHIDYDRVVFSNSFRRLARKTQVHPFADNDHTHNRLTHSIEVASVGRSIGDKVGLMLRDSGELSTSNYLDVGRVVQVACLAHDLGNPPFGHIGEASLRSWFQDIGNSKYLEKLNENEKIDIKNYEGNAHTLRSVITLEMYVYKGGMRLTAASVGTLMKYPWTSAYDCKKFNIYLTEFDFMEKIFEELGIKKISSQCWQRHPLSYLMEAADDICYALIDLEDAVEIGLIDIIEFEKVLAGLRLDNDKTNKNIKQKCAILRSQAIGQAIEDVSNTFIKHKKSLLEGDFNDKDLISASSENIREALEGAKQLAKDKIFYNKNKLMSEIASFPCLGSILSILIPSVYEYIIEGKITDKNQIILKLFSHDPIKQNDNLYNSYMKVLDYVGNLTDNSAAKMAREMSGIGMIR